MDGTNYGKRKSVGKYAFTELCIDVTINAATKQWLALEKLYDDYMQATGDNNKNDASRRAQISKLRPFWNFGRKFGVQAIAFLRNWQDNGVPPVPLNMLPTELRLRIRRGYI